MFDQTMLLKRQAGTGLNPFSSLVVEKLVSCKDPVIRFVRAIIMGFTWRNVIRRQYTLIVNCSNGNQGSVTKRELTRVL